MARWTAYAKHQDLFKSIHAIYLNRQVYNSCVLPDTTYGAAKWTLTKQAQNKLSAAQTKMERSMLNTTYMVRKTSIWVRERTKVIDIMSNVRTLSDTREGRWNAAETTDVPRVPPLGDHTARNGDSQAVEKQPLPILKTACTNTEGA